MKLKVNNLTPDERMVAFNREKDAGEALDIWFHGGFIAAAKYLTAHGWTAGQVDQWKLNVEDKLEPREIKLNQND